MRALFLTHNYPRYAGDPVGSFVLRLAVSLKAQGIDVHVVAPTAPDAPADDAIEDIPVTRFRYAPRKFETLAYTGTMAAQVRQSWKARLAMVGFLASGYRTAMRVIAQSQVDVLHAHWWFPAGLVARAVHARTGVPYVVTMHGSDVRLAVGAPGGAALFRSVTHRAAALTTVSTWLAQQVQHLDPGAKPVIAPMPVVPGLFFAGDSRQADRLLFVGKLAEQKGLHHLLRALALMSRRATLDVVGAGRIDDAAVRALATELNVADRITWHPLLSQQALAPLYRNAAIHVIPAINEGLGLTAVEALLSETPVVAFDSGGLPDIVVPEHTGLLVPPGDVRALAAALDRLLGDHELRARLGREGRQFALTRFGPEAIAQRYAEALRNAAARGTR
jgi:glycosyltransferase involved in cell wall biosynthesis